MGFRRHRTGSAGLAVRGLTMVELLVAMAVGLFLLAGLLQVLSSSRASYRAAETRLRIQENGRFAAQQLAADLRGARSSGCRSVALDEYFKSLNVLACSLFLEDCAGDHVVTSASPLGYDSGDQGGVGWLSELSEDAYGAVGDSWVRGDVLVFWGALGEGRPMKVSRLKSGETPPPEGTLSILGGGLDEDELALVSDCEGSDIFEITAVSTREENGETKESDLSFAAGSDTNRSSALSRAYNRVGTHLSPGGRLRARVYPFDYRVYFICCTGPLPEALDLQDGEECRSQPGSDVYRPALCRWSASEGARQQLVGEVADMALTFDGVYETYDSGEPTETRFLGETAEWVSENNRWDDVRSVTIRLLVSDTGRVLTQRVTPPAVGNNPQLPAEDRMYAEFEVSAGIRAPSPWFID